MTIIDYYNLKILPGKLIETQRSTHSVHVLKSFMKKKEFRLAQGKGYFSTPCTFITPANNEKKKKQGKEKRFTNLCPW